MLVRLNEDISQCKWACPFYSTEQGGVMYCGHPYFDNKSFFDRYIITNENSIGGFPDKCPLKREQDASQVQRSNTP